MMGRRGREIAPPAHTGKPKGKEVGFNMAKLKFVLTDDRTGTILYIYEEA